MAHSIADAVVPTPLSLANPSPRVMARGRGRSIADPSLDPAAVRRALDEQGIVLLRDFRIDGASLAAFSRGLCARPFVHGGARPKVTDDDRVQLAEIGHAGLRVHCEMAYTPLRPHICIFACERPPVRDGQTLLCDGVAVAQQLTEATATAFAQHPFVHVRRYSAATWQRTFKTTDLDVLRRRLAAMDSIEYELCDDGSLWTRHRGWAFTQRPGAWRAFANSLSSLADQVDGAYPFVEWADGRPIEPDLRAEVVAAMDACTVAHQWHAGDVLVIDNWRALHGRRGFPGTQRRVLATFGYAADWDRQLARPR